MTSFEPIGVSPTFASSVGGLDRADGSGEEEVSDEEVTVDADMDGNGNESNSEVEDLFEAWPDELQTEKDIEVQPPENQYII